MTANIRKPRRELLAEFDYALVYQYAKPCSRDCPETIASRDVGDNGKPVGPTTCDACGHTRR